jgi:murein DD-endopeptidase MepM/ murein hydrolase activator NlpD
MRSPLLALLLLVTAMPLQAEESVHVVQPKQTLSSIARLYGISMASLVSLNEIEDPNKVKIGTSLKLPAGVKQVKPIASATAPATTPATAPLVLSKKSATPDWRHYGPLQVDWSNWRSMAGSLVAPSINKEGQPLYVAVNCGAKKLNVTGPAGAWKAWEVPAQEFEKELLGAVCRDKSLQKG